MLYDIEPPKEKIVKTNAPKRPKTLFCDVHHSVAKGIRYYATISFLGEDIYEVFTGLNHNSEGEIIIPKTVERGTITKIKRGTYVLKDSVTKNEYSLTHEHTDPGADVLTRMISTSIRHGVDSAFIVHQIEKTRGDLQSFSKVLARVLKKYIKDGVRISGETCPECKQEGLVRENGCRLCKNCGWTTCS
jgi:ribonucleoside-diphosphate reductase alpha chain